MLLKENLKRMKKVGITVYSKSGQKFSDNKLSKRLTVYDSNPDEVLRLVERALSQQ